MSKAKEKSGSGQKMIVISRSQAVLLSGFLLFLLFWVFVLGIFVGKGVIPGAMFDIKQPIKKVRALLGLNEKIQYEKPKEGNLDFYKELVKKKSDAKIESLVNTEDKLPDQKITLSKDLDSSLQDKNEARGVIKPQVTGEEAGSPDKDEAIEAPAMNEQQKQLQSRPSSTEAQPLKPEPEQTAMESYSVQIAAITDFEMAAKMVKELVDSGYDAYYYTATVNGKKKYRIMCGRFQVRSDAVQYQLRLKNELGYNGFISKVDIE